jgi:outer membrane immunogenic protein
MKKVAVGVAFALAVVTSNAAADGIDRRYPPSIAAPQPYIAPPTWTGLYIGAGIGAGAIVHDITVRDDLGSLLSFDGIGGEGAFGTVTAGWDWQLGTSTVLGVFADYDFSDVSTDLSVLGGLVRAGVDHDNSWSVGARLGFLANPSTLWYATAGYTEADFEAFANLDGVGRVSADRSFSGYFVGAGVDTRLAASNWYLRLEYRFSEFDSERLFRDELGPVRLEVEPSMHTARATLTYKFNTGTWGGWTGWGSKY